MALPLATTAGIVYLQSGVTVTVGRLIIDAATIPMLSLRVTGSEIININGDAGTTYFDYWGAMQMRPSGSAPVFTFLATGVGMAGGVLLFSINAPTITSGFGTAPSVVANNGTAAFTINVGTGGTATGGVIGLPTATTGWVVHVVNITNPSTSVTAQTAGTVSGVTITNFSRTTGLAGAWAASDILRCVAVAY